MLLPFVKDGPDMEVQILYTLQRAGKSYSLNKAVAHGLAENRVVLYRL